MEGKIYISGLIGTLENEKGVELIDVIQQVKAQPEATSFTVYIDSDGGVVDTGFEIYNYLKSLKAPIKTIGSGIVASIATVIFMSGDIRILRPGTNFMIHNPLGGIEYGTANEILSYGEMLKSVQGNLVSFYTKQLNVTEEAIQPLLDHESWLNIDQCMALGFITQNDLPMVARAYINLNDKSMTEKDKSWFETLISSIVNKATAKPAIAMTVTDADGVIIEFPELADGDTPKVGDKANVAGEPANGTYLVGDINHVFENGELIEIMEAGDNSEEVAALKAENEALKEQLATSQNRLEVLVSDVTNLKKKITSRLEVNGKNNPPKKEDVVHDEPVNRLSGVAAKIKQLNN